MKNVRTKKTVYLCVKWKQRGLNSHLPKQKVKRKHEIEQSSGTAGVRVGASRRQDTIKPFFCQVKRIFLVSADSATLLSFEIK